MSDESREEILAQLRADRRPGPRLASDTPTRRPATTVEPLPEPPGSFEAHYSGQCPSCNLGFAVGSRIRCTDDGAYVHARCPDR